MSDPLNFLSGQPAEAEVVSTPDPVVEAPPVEQVAEGPARGPDGKFAARQAETPPVTETAPVVAPEPAKPEPKVADHVPLGALLEERDKGKAEKARADALAKQLADMQAPKEPPTQDETLKAALYTQNLRSSRRFAEREYGKETIATVHEWANERCDPTSQKYDHAFNQQMFASEDPYEAAYQAYNREKIIAEVKPDDFAAFKAWQAAQASLAAQPAPTHQPAPDTPVPRSLANAPGNGAAGSPHVPVGPGQAFVSVIPR